MRRHCVHLFPLISILLLLPTFSFGQAWSGILAPSRAINWGNAGLPATLPDGETTPNPWTPPARTQCGSTISSGASPATINAALAACSPGTYVLLGPGTFNFNNANVTMYAQNGVTLRGSGAQSTTLSLSGTAWIQFALAWNNGYCTWKTGFSAGSTSLTMNGCNIAPVAGELLQLNQCDTGYTGNVVSNVLSCATGSSADNGGLYICGENNACQTDSDTGTNHHQYQFVYVTSVTGPVSGTYTVNFTPAIYMPNWSVGQTPTVAWVTTSSSGNAANPYGNALEDMTIYTTTGDSENYIVSMNDTYASWIKGVRFVGSPANSILGLNDCKNCLVANNYFFSDIGLDGDYPVPMQLGTSSDNLIINNIMASSVPWEGNGGLEGNVFAYNYGRDTFTMYYENKLFDHHSGSSFDLFDTNELGEYLSDNTWGTHNLNTYFRNYASGWDGPYQIASGSPEGMDFEKYQRFMNIIGNSIGPGPGSSPLSTYQATGSGGGGFIFQFNSGDSLTLSSSMRWGNCDTVTNTCRFQSSEVPTSLGGNAAPFVNSVPGSDNLPCSFFLAGYTSTPCTPHANGGTGLSWWKVCTSWTTFPTSCATSQTQPFPPVGPDVTGGPYVNGTAYDIPAAIAFQNLPIDTSLQNSYSITGSSWSGGTETLTVSGLPNTTHLMGGFQITGVSACNTQAGGEFRMTSSSSTTISYSLASNPGSCAGGTMRFPDVRQFDERVYQDDSAVSVNPPTGLSAVVQ